MQIGSGTTVVSEGERWSGSTRAEWLFRPCRAFAITSPPSSREGQRAPGHGHQEPVAPDPASIELHP